MQTNRKQSGTNVKAEAVDNKVETKLSVMEKDVYTRANKPWERNQFKSWYYSDSNRSGAVLTDVSFPDHQNLVGKTNKSQSNYHTV